jgi:hypothetical protein
VPKLLTSLDALQLYATGAHYVAGLGAAARDARRAAQALDAPRAAPRDAARHRRGGAGARARPLRLEELAGKTIVTTTVNDERLAPSGTRACTW